MMLMALVTIKIVTVTLDNAMDSIHGAGMQTKLQLFMCSSTLLDEWRSASGSCACRPL